MFTLDKFLEAIEYKVSGGEAFGWKCYGPNARFLDFNIDLNYIEAQAIFDSVTQEVYQITVHNHEQGFNYRWFNPNYVDAYKEECKNRNIDDTIFLDDIKFSDTEDFDDILVKTKAIVNNRYFDKRIVVQLDLPKDLIEALHDMAREQKTSLDEFLEKILQAEIDRVKSSAE